MSWRADSMRSFTLTPTLRFVACVLLLLVIVSDLLDLGASTYSPASLLVLIGSYVALISYFLRVELGLVAATAVAIAALVVGQAGYAILVVAVVTIVVSFLGRLWARLTALGGAFLWGILTLLDTHGHQWSSLLSVALISVCFCGLGWVGQWFWTQRVGSEEHVRRLEQESEAIRADERRALARELHDAVAHQLTVVVLQIAGTRRSTDVEKLRDTLSAIDGASRSALTELRLMLRLLRDQEAAAGSEQPVAAPPAADISEILSGLGEQMDGLGVSIESSCEPQNVAVSGTLATSISRLLQEACTNVAKYADRSQPAQLEVATLDDALFIAVTNRIDPGQAGAVGALSSGHGLQSMRERVDLLQGSFFAGAVGERWEVRISLPTGDLRAESAKASPAGATNVSKSGSN